MSETTFEFQFERGVKYRVGDHIVGGVTVDIPEGGSVGSMDVRVERRHGDRIVVLSRHDLGGRLQGPQLVERDLALEIPDGSFWYASKWMPVELYLVAEAFGASPGRAMWRLEIDEGRIAGELSGASKEYEHDDDEPPWLGIFAGLVVCAFLFILGATVVFGTLMAIVLGLFALAVAAGIMFLLWNESDGRRAISNHLSSTKLELVPSLDGSSIRANLQFTTGEEPKVEKVVFHWKGIERRLVEAENAQAWREHTFMSRPVPVATKPELGAQHSYDFTDNFEIPPAAAPSFATDFHRVEWQLDVEIQLAGAYSAKLTAPFEVATPRGGIRQESTNVVASQWANDSEETVLVDESEEATARAKQPESAAVDA